MSGMFHGQAAKTGPIGSIAHAQTGQRGHGLESEAAAGEERRAAAASLHGRQHGLRRDECTGDADLQVGNQLFRAQIGESRDWRIWSDLAAVLMRRAC
jgi:hypothetical protein